ncbi:DUF6250 domain-containing protein [Pelagicoccus sp. SDUM812003]|uniref:DUF6250 domain-containing protein n=1 Tax=Pelagicoccus sp. SDUM812003 TaxID=3041267 RepID=UPI00280F4081|nr:DUF6250 domain-containing protein [Pelagicoccus sp. SDUM812003]MDQ8203223.1 DUF6250 domain-containing protein [Pelagicoccus sp. SDUM812003]
MISKPLLLALLCLAVWACGAEPARDDRPTSVIYQDDFENGLENWVVEQQPGGTVEVKDGNLVIDDEKGCTVWFKRELHAPVRIRYHVTLSADQRVSDMNCFWMASDPDHPDDLFAQGHGRTGAFATYDDLQLYYVGYGGNHNSTTRFRRYLGKGEKPLLEGYDLRGEQHLLKADHTYEIELVADENGARYYRDGELVFEYEDPQPLSSGWFGFRTVWSKTIISDFKVERLEKGAGE